MYYFKWSHNDTWMVTGDHGGYIKYWQSNMNNVKMYHNSSFLTMLERRVWQRDFRDKHVLQPDVLSYPEMVPPIASRENTSNAVTTRFVKTATNKVRF